MQIHFFVLTQVFQRSMKKAGLFSRIITALSPTAPWTTTASYLQLSQWCIRIHLYLPARVTRTRQTISKKTSTTSDTWNRTWDEKSCIWPYYSLQAFSSIEYWMTCWSRKTESHWRFCSRSTPLKTFPEMWGNSKASQLVKTQIQKDWNLHSTLLLLLVFVCFSTVTHYFNAIAITAKKNS